MTIRLERDERGIVTVLMDRPDKRNAFTLEMYREFGDIFDRLNADDSVRCIVMRGAGGAFCAGSDIGGFDENRNGAGQAREYAEFTLAMTDRLKLTPHPPWPASKAPASAAAWRSPPCAMSASPGAAHASACPSTASG
ncbi:enoyl-CoA hydratase [Bordetella trematum]|nr:enoyl-CoA hydratase [Bordetella trematum]